MPHFPLPFTLLYFSFAVSTNVSMYNTFCSFFGIFLLRTNFLDYLLFSEYSLLSCKLRTTNRKSKCDGPEDTRTHIQNLDVMSRHNNADTMGTFFLVVWSRLSTIKKTVTLLYLPCHFCCSSCHQPSSSSCSSFPFLFLIPFIHTHLSTLTSLI